MSWEQIGNSIKFAAFFVAAKVGKTGLADVTVDVRNPAGTLIVAGGAAVEVGGGLYSYTLASGNVTVEGEYTAVFKTADGTVDAKHVPSLWIVGRAGVENLDASIASRLPTAGYTTPPTIGAIAGAVLDEPLASHGVVNTPGYKLGLIGQTVVTVSAPVASSGTLSLVRGDDYDFAHGRHLTFSSAGWPDLTGTASDKIVMTVRRRAEAFGSGSDAVLFTANDRVASRVFGAGTQSIVFELTDLMTQVLLPGTATGKYDIEVTLPSAGAEVITLTVGIVDVIEDQTRH